MLQSALLFEYFLELPRSRDHRVILKQSDFAIKIMLDVHGLPMKPSVSLPLSDIDSCRPSTSLAYSSCNLAASFVLTLHELNKCFYDNTEKNLLINFVGQFNYTAASGI